MSIVRQLDNWACVCMHADGILYWTPLILDGILTGNFNGKVVTGARGVPQQQTTEDCGAHSAGSPCL